MRKRQSFMLTILTADPVTNSFCGQLKLISSGQIFLFTTLDEMNRLIASLMENVKTPTEELVSRRTEEPQGSC
jgi:hypothetical protein